MLKKGMTVRNRGRGGREPRLRKLVLYAVNVLNPTPSDWPQPHFVAKAGAWILNYPVSVFQLLGLQPCATMPDSKYSYVISLGNVFKIVQIVCSMEVFLFSFIVENSGH